MFFNGGRVVAQWQQRKEGIYTETEISYVHKFYLQENIFKHNIYVYKLWYTRSIFFCHQNVSIGVHPTQFRIFNATHLFFSKMPNGIIELKTCEDRINSVQHSQSHGCWCPGSLRRHDISNHDIDYVEKVSSCFTRGRISTIRVMSMWRNYINCTYMFSFPLKNLAS